MRRAPQFAFATTFALLIFGGSARAHNPVEFLEVLSVRPANLVEHAVELKSTFDDVKAKVMLSGPELFSHAVACMGRPVNKPTAYLNWYKIADPPSEPKRTVSVLDLVRGGENTSLTIEGSEYFLSPAQRITVGPPDPVPEGLDHYKAYRVVDAAAVEMAVEITRADEMGQRTLAKPLFVCIPTEEWHHDVHFEMSHSRGCLVVYAMTPQERSQTVSTMDQFGLNQLQSTKSEWLCVRGSLLRFAEK